MNLRYKPQVARQLKKLPLNEQKKILRKFELIKKEPYSGKKLQGEFRGLMSIRAWPYRIVYEIKRNTVVVYKVKHRQSSYKK